MCFNTFAHFYLFTQKLHNAPANASSAGYFSILPEEISLYVLSFLSVKELAEVARVSRYWRRLSEVMLHGALLTIYSHIFSILHSFVPVFTLYGKLSYFFLQCTALYHEG